LTPLEIAGLTIFILVLFGGIFTTIFGLPGTIVVFLDVIIYSWVTGGDKVGLKIIAILFFLSLAAESVDLILGAVTSRRYGLSAKEVLAAIIGGIAGVVLLTPLLLGLGTITGMFLGGATGFFLVDYLDERRLKPAFRVGFKAFMKRIFRVLLKGFFAIVMTIITLTAIYS
jgi:uncharacterized protein YqgC (DUF456 family)